MNSFRQEFLAFALQQGVLRFGEFITKAGRPSPYFFNAGLFSDGASLGSLGDYYAQALLTAEADGLGFDMLYGPAYKGITLAAATAIALARRGRNLPFAYNRKEAKDHGEGGLLVGAPLKGRVVIIDDVLTDGASKRESVEVIRAAGATPVAVAIALDRMERKGVEGALSARSAVQEFEAEYGLPVLAIANLDDLMGWLDATADTNLAAHRERVAAYRARFGVER
ncbi:orotate phosphoribosyltransferase [Derxia gummosa]|uniref:Orotate phosphoribosyltransferase n=1 Tax=Derxia gummosa DSM 723 TaxID=1121388 RepID=A0A8B6X2A0_9BURK|nr:orotate phosphoribosyltransferase [Derxia gummosa]